MSVIEVDLSRIAPTPNELNGEAAVIAINNSDADVDFPISTERNIPPDSNYWKWTICAVTAPAALFGFPIHLIFTKNKPLPLPLPRAGTSRRKQWLTSIIDPEGQPKWQLLTTVLLLIFSTYFALFLLKAFGTIFYYLIIKGDINPAVSHSIWDFCRAIPAVLPVQFAWIYGYSIQSLINSFDSEFREKFTQVSFTGGTGFPKSIKYIPRGLYPKRMDVRLALVWMYGAIVFIHIVHILADSSWKPAGVWDSYWVDMMYSFTLPFYCTFCWAISSQYEHLAENLQNLQAYEAQPTFQILGKIKICFKQIIAQVYSVNDFFRLFMSWVIPVLIFSIGLKILYAVMVLFGYAALKNFLPDSMDGIANSTLPPGFADPAPPAPGPGPGPHDPVAPEMVRAAVGYIFVASVQFYLLGFTIWQAVRVNDQSRYLHVLMNDYGTQVGEKMSPELYQAYRMLKYFIHSTMEQENSALLRIPILSMLACIPQFTHRLQGYSIRS